LALLTLPWACIELVSATTAHQLDQLHRGELDCCFISGPLKKPIAAEIDSTVFQTDAYVVIVHRNHPMASKGSISIEELGSEKILLSGQPKDSTFNQHVNQLFDHARITPDIEYIPQTHVGVLGRVALDRGVYIATEGYGCIYSNALSTLRLSGTDAKLPTLLAWRKDIQSETSITFRDFALNSLHDKSSTERHDHSANNPTKSAFEHS